MKYIYNLLMVARMPSVAALRTFDAAARAGSFKAAAGELGVSPTSVSHQIRALEDQLGAALFTRGVRRVDLTVAGERLARATEDAFARIRGALEDVADMERTLRVTTTPAFAALWLSPRMTRFEAEHPDLTLQIDTSTTVVDLARQRSVDVALRYGRDIAPDGMVTTQVAEESFSAFCAPRMQARFAAFHQAPLIETAWREARFPGMTWSSWAAAAGEAEDQFSLSDRIRRFDQEHYVVHAAMAGQGVALVSTILTALHTQEGWLVPYRGDVRLRGLGYYAVTTPALAQTRKVRRFIAWLKRQTGEAVRSG